MYNPKFPRWVFLVFLAIIHYQPSYGQESPLARTPPMGWSTWNHFGCKITDAIVRTQADAMVKTGMKAAGYTYVNIDDCWEGKRDAKGFIRGNDRFPDMKALADYVHSKGLKIGIYSSPGATTCEYFEGSLGHEEEDARAYANWGFDFLKYDWCYTKGNQFELNKKMFDAVRKTGRPMVLSLSGNSGRVWTWAASTGANMWRTTDDMRNNYYVMVGKGLRQAGLEKYAGPSHWNDPDMLEIGNAVEAETAKQVKTQLPPDLQNLATGTNEEEWRTQFSLWAILAAPLIATCDLTRASPQALAILTNPEVIAVDQDPAGRQGYRVSKEGPLEVWVKPLADGSKAVGLFAIEDADVPITVNFRDVGLGESASVRDLWRRKDLGVFQGSYTATVPWHGVVMLRIR